MTININTMVPGVYIKTDNTNANTAAPAVNPALIIAHCASDKVSLTQVHTGNVASLGTGTPAYFGAQAFLSQTSQVPLYVLSLPVTGGTKAVAVVTAAGVASASGTLAFYCGDEVITMTVSKGTKDTDVLKALVTAFSVSEYFDATLAADGKSINLTAKYAGVYGNDLQLITNYYPTDTDVPGLAVTITPFSGGKGVPDYSVVGQYIEGSVFDFVMIDAQDPATINKVATLFNDSTGKWAPANKTYGHLWAGLRGKASDFKNIYNNQHLSILAIEPACVSTSFGMVCSYVGACADSFVGSPAANWVNFELPEIATKIGGGFTFSDRDSLLKQGFSTYVRRGQGFYVERVVTTYTQNADGEPDNSYVDALRLFMTAYLERAIRQMLNNKFSNVNIANTPTPKAVTTQVIHTAINGVYQDLHNLGIIDDPVVAGKSTVVTRNANDPTRVDITLAPDYVAQLYIFAVDNQFTVSI